MKKIEIIEVIAKETRGGIKLKSNPNEWVSPHPTLEWKDRVKDINKDDEVEINVVELNNIKYYLDVKLLKKGQNIPNIKQKEKDWDKIEEKKHCNFSKLNAVKNAYLMVTCLIDNKIITDNFDEVIVKERDKIYKYLTGKEWADE